MKYFLLISTILFCFCAGLKSQTRAELEEKRNKTLTEITYVDNLLKTTTREKGESINEIKIIGNKLVLRESVINGMNDEVSLLSKRIDLNKIAIEMMETDLIILKNDYAKAVLNSYRYQKEDPEIVYILSAKDFNQAYKRLKYFQQIAIFRRRESETIMDLKKEIETSKLKLENDLEKVSDLKKKEEQQKRLLKNEQERKEKMIKSLSNKEKELKKELDDKKRIAKKIENEINRLIEEERKRAIKSDSTPEQKLIGENFEENKGRLPWPVANGTITSHFGIQKHPVIKYVTEDNIGIEITSSGTINARSIFNGEVARVFPIPGANMTVIIRHGKYLSVYANIINVKVKPGEKVVTKQEIGEVYSDPAINNNCILKFMIFETNAKYLDPELWISKNVLK